MNSIGFRIIQIGKKFIQIQSDFKSDPNNSDWMKISNNFEFGSDRMSLDFGLYFGLGLIHIEIGYTALLTGLTKNI